MTTTAMLFTRKSSNVKTGPIAVTTSDRDTCPTDCVFRDNGCYAEQGPLGGLWRAMSAAGADADFKNGRNTMHTLTWEAMCDRVADLPKGDMWRHNQAGDLPRKGGKIDRVALNKLVHANKGKRGFTYTHHNVLQDQDNRAAVADAVADGFVINLSGNNLAHADALADLGIAPVVVVVPIDQTANTVTPKGRKVVVCPATIRDDVSCATCGLCSRIRDAIVAFPAHGASKRKAELAAA